MPNDDQIHLALSDAAARQLANATKTTAQLDTITPRWLTRLLQWVPVEAGIYRLNRVTHPEDVEIACPPRDESELPQTYVDYDEKPREYFLSSVSTVVDIHTRVSDLYSSPYDQIGEQLRLTIETIKERQESELINSPDYGMIANTADRTAHLHHRRPAHSGRLRRADHQGLEGAGLLPDPPERGRRLRARVHPPWRPAGDGQPVRLAVHHLARPADHPVRQGAARQGTDPGAAAADRRATAGRGRSLPARACPANAGPACPCGSWASTAMRSRLT